MDKQIKISLKEFIDKWPHVYGKVPNGCIDTYIDEEEEFLNNLEKKLSSEDEIRLLKLEAKSNFIEEGIDFENKKRKVYYEDQKENDFDTRELIMELEEDYHKVEILINEYKELETIVKSNYIENIKVNELMSLVRNDNRYKKSKIKNRLEDCVRYTVNSMNREIIYSYELDKDILYIYTYIAKKEFDAAYSRIIDLDNRVDISIEYLDNEGNSVYSPYISKLYEIKDVLNDMIEFERYQNDIDLAKDLLYLFNREEKSNKNECRFYKSKTRLDSKERNRANILELKNMGFRNIEIAKKLNLSTSYVSELINRIK